MKKFLIAPKSKQSVFFSFQRILKYQETDDNNDFLLKEFQDNFEIEQQAYWSHYWITQGEDVILQAWNEKYKDYLQENVDKNVQETQENLFSIKKIEKYGSSKS